MESTRANDENPYSFNNNIVNDPFVKPINDPFAKPINDPFVKPSSTLAQSYMPSNKPSNNYGFDNNPSSNPNPYASINFEGPSGGNGFPSSGTNKNNAFAPTGNDYLKFSNMGGDNKKGGFNSDFPK